MGSSCKYVRSGVYRKTPSRRSRSSQRPPMQESCSLGARRNPHVLIKSVDIMHGSGRTSPINS
eukprot:1536548-Heterocapsa_arctica.AAC.1